jgi:hypothetical protein
MALIERVTLNETPFIGERTVATAEDGSSREEYSVERVPTAYPGLRIQARSTTASLSDYADYDLKTLLSDEKRRSLSDGVSS